MAIGGVSYIPSPDVNRRMYTEHHCNDGRHWSTLTFTLGYDWDIVIDGKKLTGANVSRITDHTTGGVTFEIRYLNKTYRRRAAEGIFQVAERVWSRNAERLPARPALRQIA